jgi:hypothetical protein
MSLKKLKYSAIRLAGLVIKATAIKHGDNPRIRNRIIPGIRKLENGECSKMDKGNPPSNLPEGEMIKQKPPPIALIPRNNSKEIRMFLAMVGFMVFLF